MFSRSLSFLRTRPQAQVRVSPRVPSTQIIIAVTLALLILSLWMRFILAMEIESVGRQIQSKTEELEKVERDNTALRATIAEITSQNKLSVRATELDYQTQTPVYLTLSEPLAPADGTIGEDTWLQIAGSSGEASTSQPPSILSGLVRTLAGSAAANAAPER